MKCVSYSSCSIPVCVMHFALYSPNHYSFVKAVFLGQLYLDAAAFYACDGTQFEVQSIYQCLFPKCPAMDLVNCKNRKKGNHSVRHYKYTTQLKPSKLFTTRVVSRDVSNIHEKRLVKKLNTNKTNLVKRNILTRKADRV